jgi:dethiobiotin synthetase
VNPYAFAEPIAPHIAAQQVGVRSIWRSSRRPIRRLAAAADVVVVEGAGGWRVPLNEREDMADLAQRSGPAHVCWWWDCAWAVSITPC